MKTLLLSILILLAACSITEPEPKQNTVYNQWCSDDVILYEAMYTEVYEIDGVLHIYAPAIKSNVSYTHLDTVEYTDKYGIKHEYTPFVNVLYIQLEYDGDLYYLKECDAI